MRLVEKMQPNQTVLRIAIGTILIGSGLLYLHSRVCGDDHPQAEVVFESVGEIQPIKEAEHRMGRTDRIILIDDQWEYDRCKLLLPKLPEIDLSNKSLLVLMSWKARLRSLEYVRSENETLVIGIKEQLWKGPWADSYHPPNFLVWRLPSWAGPVRVEINEKPQFMIERGEALAQHSAELWEEILRIHSGGEQRTSQKVRYYRQQWHDVTDDQIKETILTNKEKFRAIDQDKLYPMLFGDLIDIRARPIIPRIFSLIESMSPHDKAYGPACGALVGIGGPEMVENCEKALKSWNPLSRQTAMSVLANLELPQTRSLAHEHLSDFDGTSQSALVLLKRIGIGKDDVPIMVRALQEFESLYLEPEKIQKRKLTFSPEIIHNIVIELGLLGASAKDALPTLEVLTTEPRLAGFRENAQKAIDKINTDKADSTE